MTDDYGNEIFVTPRELHQELRVLDDKIDQTREEVAAVKTWQKILAAAVPLTIAFGPDVASAIPWP